MDAVVDGGDVVLDVDVLLSGGTWFEWPLYDVYMYPQSLVIPPFGHPLVVLCHILLNIGFGTQRCLGVWLP